MALYYLLDFFSAYKLFNFSKVVVAKLSAISLTNFDILSVSSIKTDQDFATWLPHWTPACPSNFCDWKKIIENNIFRLAFEIT